MIESALFSQIKHPIIFLQENAETVVCIQNAYLFLYKLINFLKKYLFFLCCFSSAIFSFLKQKLHFFSCASQKMLKKWLSVTLNRYQIAEFQQNIFRQNYGDPSQQNNFIKKAVSKHRKNSKSFAEFLLKLKLL